MQILFLCPVSHFHCWFFRLLIFQWAFFSNFEPFWVILSFICGFSFTVSYRFILFYTAFSIPFLWSLDKKLINYSSKWYEPFPDYRRPLHQSCLNFLHHPLLSGTHTSSNLAPHTWKTLTWPNQNPWAFLIL